MKGVRWVVLSIVIVASFVAYVLRTNFNIVGETMMNDLGMNPVQLGMTFSAFAAGYVVPRLGGAPPSPSIDPEAQAASAQNRTTV